MEKQGWDLRMIMKLKILHIIGGGEFGGAEQHILSLMEEFKKRDFITPYVVTFYDAEFSKKLKELGIQVIVIKDLNRFDFRHLYKELVTIFRKIQPDIVHTHGVRANFFGRLAAKTAKVPLILTTVHSFLKHDYPKPISWALAALMNKSTQGITHHYVAISKAIKDDLLSSGIPDSKVSVIYNGIYVENYSPTEELMTNGAHLRKEWDLPDNAFVIGTTARLVPVKGLQYLIKGLSIALQEDKTLYLVIIGDGPEKEELIKLSDQLGIGSHIRFVGFRKDVPACLSAIDLYINTSISEGQSLSLLEAMAAEKPAIVTAVGGMKEMVENGRTGIQIPSQSGEAVAEAIQQVKSDILLQDNLKTNAKHFVNEQLSVKIMGQHLIELYQQLVEGSLKK